MIERLEAEWLKAWLGYFSAVGLVGPRQVGKITQAIPERLG